MKKITIISITLIVISQNINCQNIHNLTLGEIIDFEKKGLKYFYRKKENYKEISVHNYNFFDFSHSTDNLKDYDIFYKLFLFKDTVKRVLYFDKKHSETKPIFGTDVCYTDTYNLYFVYNTYFDLEKNNYAGFIVSDKKKNLNIFFGYKYDRNNNSSNDIDKIFLLDSNLLTKKQLLFKKGILRYITEPVRENHEYKYEKSYKSNKYIELTEKTKLSNILKLLETKFDTLNYKILYINGLGMSSKKPFRREVYPLWSASNILYYPCMVLYKDEKENKVYYRQKYGENNIYERVIDNQIRGELECFDWLY